MRFEISNLDTYLESLDDTLHAFNLIVPTIMKHGISRDAAWIGWTVLCLIDVLGAALQEDEVQDGEDWKL
jgi:hypothetical protein